MCGGKNRAGMFKICGGIEGDTPLEGDKSGGEGWEREVLEKGRGGEKGNIMKKEKGILGLKDRIRREFAAVRIRDGERTGTGMYRCGVGESGCY